MVNLFDSQVCLQLTAGIVQALNTHSTRKMPRYEAMQIYFYLFAYKKNFRCFVCASMYALVWIMEIVLDEGENSSLLPPSLAFGRIGTDILYIYIGRE